MDNSNSSNITFNKLIDEIYDSKYFDLINKNAEKVEKLIKVFIDEVSKNNKKIIYIKRIKNNLKIKEKIFRE